MDILFLGKKNGLWRSLQESVSSLGNLIQMEPDLSKGLPFSDKNEEPQSTSAIGMILFDWKWALRRKTAFFSFLSQQNTIPGLILISQSSEILPDLVWKNEAVDVLYVPFDSHILQKRIQQALQHRQTLIRLEEKQQQTTEVTHRLDVAQHQIQADLEEKDILMQEIHHRVKNNLQIVSSILTLHSSKVQDQEIREILRSTQGRVDTISLIHKKLYESKNLAEIDIQDYVQHQIHDLFYQYPVRTKNLHIDLKLIPILLAVDQAIHFALLIHELITNIFKHAFPQNQTGQITLAICRTNEAQLKLLVADNGVGLPPDTDISKTSSIGLRLIYRLIQYLDGDYSITCHHGTSYCILFPICQLTLS